MTLKSIKGAGWLKDVNDNFEALGPVDGEVDGLGSLRVARFTYDTAGTDSAGVSNKTAAAHGTGLVQREHRPVGPQRQAAAVRPGTHRADRLGQEAEPPPFARTGETLHVPTVGTDTHPGTAPAGCMRPHLQRQHGPAHVRLPQQLAVAAVGHQLTVVGLQAGEDLASAVAVQVGNAQYPYPGRDRPGDDIGSLQGTAEGAPFTRAEFDALIDLARDGIAGLIAAQKAALAG